MSTLIGSLSHSIPTALTEVITLGRTLNKRAPDVLAYFDRPRTSNGPTEAITTAAWSTCAAARSSSATSPTTSPRSLLRTGGFRPSTTPPIVKSHESGGDQQVA